MSDVESFVRFCDSEFGTAVMDREAAMVRTARDRVGGPFVRDAEAALSEATRVLASDETLVALVLNTRSEYVRSNLRREGSYFRRMVHRDSAALTERILDRVDGEREYFLGISGEEVFESSDPSTAAIAAVVGEPAD
ncbi:hypothetical protein [Halorubrum sp. N11]|uniref:hypothetical protein n=1 Tax=Halorubrum sp. N11 TaxID=3402276 RepID=UPI003EBB8D08